MRPSPLPILAVLSSVSLAQSLPATLSFIPSCAHDCIRAQLPAYIAAPFSSCLTWAGNANPEVVAAPTPADKVRAQIAKCVRDDCGAAANSDPDFQNALLGVCASASASASASVSVSVSVSASPSVGASATLVEVDVTEGAVVEEQQQRRRGLSPAAIAGTVLGALFFLLLLGVGVFFVVRRRRQRLQRTPAAGEHAERKDWQSLSSARTTPSPPLQNYESVPVPAVQARAFDFAFDVEAGDRISPIASPTREAVHCASLRPDNTKPWSPVSPVSPVFGAFQFPPVQEEAAALQQQQQGGQQGVVSLPQLPRQSMLTRADSVEWRREVEEAAERAATRVGLKVSEPILGRAPAAASESSRWTRRVSGGVLVGKGRSASGAGR